MSSYYASIVVGLVTSASCVGIDEQDVGETDDRTVLEQAVAVPGAWALSSEVHAIAQTQFVAYDDAPAWDGGANCSGTFFSGTAKLRTFLNDTFPEISGIGGYACRPNTADTSRTSMHGTGRALDVFIPTTGGAADNTKGDRVAAWLLTHAEFVGVQLVIWDHSIWSPARTTGEKLHAYGGPIPHIDHLHVEVTVEAAHEQTDFFHQSDDVGWAQVVRADLGGNGDDELGFYSTRDGAFAWYPMTAAGQLGTRQSASTLGKNWTAILGVDTDGDGRDSLAFYDAKTGTFSVYAAATSGVLGARLSSTVLGAGWTSIVAADFDGDGTDELAFYNQVNGAYGVYRTNPEGTLGARLLATTLGDGWTELVALAVAGGRPQLGFYNAANGSFAVYATTEAGGLGTRQLATALARGWSAVEPVQVAGDGRSELAFYNRATGGFSIYPIDATGQLGSRLSSFTLN